MDPNASNVSSSKELSESAEEEDEPFIPPQELDIPVGMVLVSLFFNWIIVYVTG